MTSLAVALASDSRGPSGLYLITDSRITWGTSSNRWDAGQKTFVSPNSPDIFGYCSDAYFIPMIMGQILNSSFSETLGLSERSASGRHTLFLDLVKSSIEKVATSTISNLVFFHGAREDEFMDSTFHLWKSTYIVKEKTWKDSKIILDRKSYLVTLDGSGQQNIEEFQKQTQNTAERSTSRAAIQAFCGSLEHGGDSFSGGAPQLVGLWRIGKARQFGFWWNNKRYINGIEFPDSADHTKVSWFNKLFERCNGLDGNILPGAQPHQPAVSIFQTES
ncbi:MULTISPECIES: hypothetical protein [Acetobacter]|nr:MULTISPECIES: hypothetical protein [Acetobacter]